MSQTAQNGEPAGDSTNTLMFGGFWGVAAIFVAIIMLSAPIGTRALLVALYVFLFVSSCVSLHLLLVTAPRVSGEGISARAPKYLEYAYIILFSLSLTQIFLASGKSLEYFAEDEGKLLKVIQQSAEKNITECRKYASGDGRRDIMVFYTSKYCEKLENIRSAKDSEVEDVVMNQIANDSEFMNFTVALIQADMNRPPVPVYSDIPITIRRIQSLRALKISAAEKQSDPFAWIGMVFLPISIALRITKTSMELFGKLNPVS
ncbi:MAG: hypothetical protein WCI56_07080 [Hyphomicrobiales bacterium]